MIKKTILLLLVASSPIFRPSVFGNVESTAHPASVKTATQEDSMKRMQSAQRSPGISDELYTYLQFAQNIAYQAGNVMLNYFDTKLVVVEKEDISPVTTADEEINAMVIREVEKAFPTHSILGEEGSVRKNSEYAWVCDPIDGTIPFILGIPISVFSLALVKDGTPIIGVVYDPYTNRLYSAVKDGGAFCNTRPIHVNDKKLEKGTYVDVEFSPNTPHYDVETPFHDLIKPNSVHWMRIGSVIQAGCLVASGKLAAVAFSGVIEKNVDIAAVKVIVEEAGGKVTDLFGAEQRYDGDINGALVTNGLIHDQLVTHLGKYLVNLKK